VAEGDGQRFVQDQHLGGGAFGDDHLDRGLGALLDEDDRLLLGGCFFLFRFFSLFGLLGIILFCMLTVVLGIRGVQALTSISLAPIALILLQIAITYTPFIILAALDLAILLLLKYSHLFLGSKLEFLFLRPQCKR
jgi:hypothetical protein